MRFVRPLRERKAVDHDLDSDIDMAPSESECDVEEMKASCLADKSLWTRPDGKNTHQTFIPMNSYVCEHLEDSDLDLVPHSDHFNVLWS
jgi:hypothetical protein